MYHHDRPERHCSAIAAILHILGFGISMLLRQKIAIRQADIQMPVRVCVHETFGINVHVQHVSSHSDLPVRFSVYSVWLFYRLVSPLFFSLASLSVLFTYCTLRVYVSVHLVNNDKSSLGHQLIHDSRSNRINHTA